MTPPGPDRIRSGVLQDGAFRFAVARLNDSVTRACLLHQLDGARAEVLGEALVSTALLATPSKAEEKYTLSIYGRGLIRSLNADCDHRGHLRGYLRTAPENEWPTAVTAANLMAPPGIIQVTRSLPDRVVYQGITEFRLGAIGADVALHLSTSDQVETEIRTAVTGAPGRYAAAGLSIQALPGTDLDLFVPIRAALDAAEREGKACMDRPEEFIESVLGPFGPHLLGNQTVHYRCNCSRERVLNIFRQMSPADISGLTEPDGSAVATCHWCNAEYAFPPDEMALIIGGGAEGGRPD